MARKYNSEQEFLLISMELEELWKHFSRDDPPKRVYDKARYGFRIPIDINEIKRMIRKEKSGKLLYRGKEYRIEDVNTEKEVRAKLMLDWLLDREEGAIQMMNGE